VDETTEVAALVVLAAGVAAGMRELQLASAVFATTTLLLIEKSRLHKIVERIDAAGLEQDSDQNRRRDPNTHKHYSGSPDQHHTVWPRLFPTACTCRYPRSPPPNLRMHCASRFERGSNKDSGHLGIMGRQGSVLRMGSLS
jgi:hypothetical protein